MGISRQTAAPHLRLFSVTSSLWMKRGSLIQLIAVNKITRVAT